jgi:hypothetical protein
MHNGQRQTEILSFHFRSIFLWETMVQHFYPSFCSELKYIYNSKDLSSFYLVPLLIWELSHSRNNLSF